jgi:hypothetical protein
VTGIVILVLIVALGPLAVLYGADSRLPTDRRSI